VAAALEIPLRGPKGEPVEFARTFVSHGVAELAPNRVELGARTLETTVPVPRGARTVRITATGGKLRINAVSGTVGAQARDALKRTVAHMFRLDEDLSGFYTLISQDVELGWCATGAGRMLRAPTVFKDVVKTTRTFIQTLLRDSTDSPETFINGAARASSSLALDAWSHRPWS
jgi:hypothetical protein